LGKIWYKTHKMVVPYFPLDEMPPIIMKFYDKDLFSDEYMGHQIISVKQGIAEGFINYHKSEVPEPQWIDISYGKIIYDF